MNQQQSTRSNIMTAIYANLRAALFLAAVALGGAWYANDFTFDTITSIIFGIALLLLSVGIIRGRQGRV